MFLHRWIRFAGLGGHFHCRRLERDGDSPQLFWVHRRPGRELRRAGRFHWTGLVVIEIQIESAGMDRPDRGHFDSGVGVCPYLLVLIRRTVTSAVRGRIWLHKDADCSHAKMNICDNNKGEVMKSLLIPLIALALCVSACTPQVSPTVQSTETALNFSTITPTVPLSTDTPTPLPTLTFTPAPTSTPELGFELPSDCINYDPSVDRAYYSDFSNGACNNPTLSPDGSWIVYATKIPATPTDRIRTVVRLVPASNPSSEPISIYTSKCNFIYPVWPSSEYLVLSDVPLDVGCGYTAIYGLKEAKILAILDGSVRLENRWAADKFAFFTLSPTIFGPTCAETLSGYDLRTLKTIPKITPVTPGMNIYVVIGRPIWMPDNRTLLATVRDGVCSQDSEYDCSYGNSYILSVSFTGYSPKVSHPFYDSKIDYSVRQTEEGKIELFSEEFKPVTCMDIFMEEGRMP